VAKVLLRWPSLVAGIALFLNVDVVVMPLLTLFGVHGLLLFVLAVCAASAETGYWFWYSGWLARNLAQVDPIRQTARTFQREGFSDEFDELWIRIRSFVMDARDWFVEHATQQMEMDTPLKQEVLSGALGMIRSTHIWMMYPLMIGLGTMPGGWVFAIILCRVNRVPGAFPLFLAVNGIKAWVLGLAYLWLPWWAKFLGWFLFGSILLWRILHWRRTRRAAKKDEAS